MIPTPASAPTTASVTGSATGADVLTEPHPPHEDLAARYAEHRSVLHGIALQLLADPAAAEDVIADVITHLLATGRRPRKPEGWRAYLSWAVTHRAISVLRTRAVASRATDALARAREQVAPSAEELALAHIASVPIRQALRRLPERQRQVTILRYWGGLQEAQIATRLSISRGAVKSHSARARAELRRLLSGQDEPQARRPAPGRRSVCSRPGGSPAAARRAA
ncbi:RNA polymerase sigma factor [Nonomuraea typhae]|uniref:RNA polymerase sigma factor n=1 Tax=Nonomuraea typhae TaxID=2603600 RepID=UPI0012FCB268|nr:sigma-70 family RNA polymerase sigma factor [Nonomuraea typhae]